jgi:hypothetical protein
MRTTMSASYLLVGLPKHLSPSRSDSPNVEEGACPRFEGGGGERKIASIKYHEASEEVSRRGPRNQSLRTQKSSIDFATVSANQPSHSASNKRRRPKSAIGGQCQC